MTAAEARDEEWIASVGIDLGTSTTKMILSRLRIRRTSGAFALPAFVIAERELTYCSDVYTTPLRSEDEVDEARVADILAAEYARAGVRPEDIRTGAVIITGETANKRNAERIAHALAARAGDFVVAAAGADLEGLLAAKGAGAETRSLESGETVASVDIGGGTANAAFFRGGVSLATATLRIGGRLVRIDADGTVLAAAQSFQPWLRAHGYDLSPGRRLDLPSIRELADRMAETLLSYLAGTNRDERTRLLVVGEGGGSLPEAGELLVSGGVAELMRSPEPASVAETAVHGDIGPALAHAVKRAASRYPYRWVEARQTVRATVIGAGMQAADISGATVHVSPGALPVRNVPVVKLGGAAPSDVAEAFEAGRRLYGAAGGSGPTFALAVPPIEPCTYALLQRLADAVAGEFLAGAAPHDVLAVVCRSDMAKALGQSLAIRLGSGRGIVCIDQVAAEHGDYIDIGEPVAGAAVPVVVKTLAFPVRAEAEPEGAKGAERA
ncbi:MAG TPA: ethanolamine ammonia-lyase reactivating factor EutA [Paenibacillus sp.]|nr:ethanolamine ammonia-lyase reactivating factor EutA [Paenibacillus sp.]HZG84307.1 ethanolamine ammonia-lyase reactivating factor EutA [Paenibacillus sp.]